MASNTTPDINNSTDNRSLYIDWLNMQDPSGLLLTQLSTSVSWLTQHFLLAILPVEFSTLSDATLSDFYDLLALLQPVIWLRPAPEGLQKDRLISRTSRD